MNENKTKFGDIDDDGYEFITNFWPFDPEEFSPDYDAQSVEEYEADITAKDGFTEFIHKTPYATDGTDLSIHHPNAIAIWGKKPEDAITKESL
jgi:hypothetical protein